MKTIAVFFGGKSTEHDVSIVTALASVIKPLELTKKYTVVPIYIAKNGAWYSDEKLKDIKLYSSGSIDAFLKSARPVAVKFDSGMLLVKKLPLGRSVEQRIDVAFPAMHGTYGEDGTLMGMLRLAGIPFVGCDLEASAVAMNKLLAHQVVSAAGVESHPYQGVTKHHFLHDKDQVVQQLSVLNYPLFVKPVHLGSSIGITRVKNKNELLEGLEVAFSYDDVAIVEEAVPNLIEATVPVMGPSTNPQVALVERPLLKNGAVFDFETKYLSGAKNGKHAGGKKGAQGYSEVPAKLPESLYNECLRLARSVYSIVGCEGIARIDLLIDGATKKVYFNEINPLPGGLYDHNWRAAGISSVELVEKLVEYAESRFEKNLSTTTNFSTNFLKQF